ncbi:putative Seg-like homing endonuclease, GIY-YIG family [Aeromonas phage Aes508]|uniref:Putative Seg-like homing endonuclease, GIY-YIG family n=1 Tax=Aeromonas phage Aes508 TaxID=1198013 RepID=J7KIC7_9CAUD|nr:homing endonuclease [Aeromonas phage Aes508]AFQ97192.1 putative Seg-like homing endonuclease, GIY-YIG family [Aeromonas phage Aes508]UYD57778.1 hypothetical protein MEIMHGIN_00146 [Aeromonas phage avDM3]
MHYLYKTTNLLNDKIYIGVHTTNNIDDGYMGSGKLLHLSISKYGIDNFKKEILEFFETREECLAREREIVNSEFIARHDTYNLKIGGEGGFFRNYWLGKKHNEETKLKISLANRSRYCESGVREAHSKRVSESINSRKQANTYVTNFTGKKHSEATKELIGKKTSVYQSGSGNSNFGKKWMYSLIMKKSKPVAPQDVERYISDGWQLGRKFKFD